MKKDILNRIICVGVVSLVGSTALAQETLPSGANQQPAGGQKNQNNQAPSSQSGAYQSKHASQSGNLFRVSQLIGANVQSAQGSPIGQIRDIAVDPQSGRIDFALLSLSGGTGKHPSDATARPGTGTGSSATRPSTDSTASTTDATRSDSTRSTTDSTRSTPSTPSSSGIADRSTIGAGISGAHMGRLVAVPWQLLQPAASHSASSPNSSSSSSSSSPAASASGLASAPSFMVNADPSKLQSAPAFDQSSTENQGMFAQRVYSHFGLNWNNRNSGVGGTGSGINTGTGSDRSSNPGADLGRDSARPGSPSGTDASKPKRD